MNYKNIKSGVVISTNEYYRLPNRLKNLFVGSYDSITHNAPSNYDNSSDWLETAIGISLIEDAVPSSSNDFDDSPSGSSGDDSNTDFDFGGGEFGGGGAGDTW